MLEPPGVLGREALWLGQPGQRLGAKLQVPKPHPAPPRRVSGTIPGDAE